MLKKMISIVAVAVLVFALAPAAQAAPVALTSANVTYSGQTITSIDGLNFNIEAPSSFVVTTYNKPLTMKDTGVNGTIYSSGTPTIAHQDYIRDLDIDTAWSFGNDTTEPYNGAFEANLTTSMTASIASELNEVALIMFESGGNDAPTIQAYNGTTAIGTALTLTAGISPTGDWGNTGATSYAFSAGQDSVAVGLSLADLGVTTGQTVTKFVFTATRNWDPTEIMVDSNLAATMVWRTDEIDDWAGADWTNDGGATWIAPIADLGMIVNSGTATVSTDVSGTAAGSLSIGGVIPGGTVEIASAGTLAVTGGDPVIADVIVGDGGTLRVNGLLVTGGVNVVNVEVGGTLSFGGGSMIRSTMAESTSNVEVTVDGKLSIEGDGKSYLGDTGDHPVVLGDGDDHSTNLTLGDAAVIDWVFGGVGADNNSYLTIKGLTTLGASLTVNIIDGGGSADSDDIYLLRSLGGVVNPTAAILGDKPEGWTGTLEWVQRGPSLWDLQLTGLTTSGQNAGDTNGDGFVNETDRANFELALGLAGAELIAKGFAFDPDFDNDGDADLDDFVMLRESFGNNYNLAPAVPDLSQAPEPTTMSLMALGALAILRRRRRK
jgi:hypothetical protein